MTAVLLQELSPPEVVDVDVEGEVETDPPVGRRALGAISAGLVTLCFLQVPGRIVSDTKVDIAVAPLSFLHNALYLWNPQPEFGGVPFQAYGYLLPMGPFFVIGHLLHLPTWVIQRLWVSVLLVAAFWGIVRLAEAFGIGSSRSRVLAGLFFVFAPPVTLLGATSAYILPFTLLPWVMLPLVRGAREGSPRLAACRSGVAILLIGGINASATLAVLPLPILWFLTRTPGRRRRELFWWWVLAVVLACGWWAGALWLEGRYGFDLLPYTESAQTTTAATSLFEVLRGNSYWVAYDQIGPTAIRSGLEAVTSPLMILAGVVMTALGLFGLAHRAMKERLLLVGALALTIVLVGAGYSGSFSGPFPGFVHDLLSGPLALFRNVWKFQPMINLVLVLGIAHALHVLAGSLRRSTATLDSRKWVHKSQWLVMPVAAVAVLGLSIPFLTDNFYPPGAFGSVPTYWQSTASWLAGHAGTTTSLVVPGTSIGVYRWGAPIDEPTQWLFKSNWAVRGLIPDSSVGNVQTMDAVDQVLASGVPNPGLAPFLAQTGVRYVVERNDLSPAEGAPGPLQVHLTLSATPGLQRVATFGPSHSFQLGQVALDIPAIEVYEVGQPVATVTTAPVANSVVVSGGAQGLLALDQVGLDPGNRAVLLAGDGGVRSPRQTWVVTDTAPRVGVTFGATRFNQTYVLSRGQNSPVTAQPPVGWTAVQGASHKTVATFIGVKGVTASSFGSNYLYLAPEDQPAAAIDGNPETAWVADAANNSEGQWIQVRFDHAIDLSRIGLALSTSAQTPTVTEVMITTAAGSVLDRVHPSGQRQTVRAPSGSSDWLRITFAKTVPPRHPSLFSGAGIRQVTIPGVTAEKAESVPADEVSRFSSPTARPPDFVFTSPVPGSAYGLSFGGDDPEPRMVRIFQTPRTETYAIHGTVTPRPSAALAAVLNYLGNDALSTKTIHLPCGKGPQISVDGKDVNTEVSGVFGGLSGFRQLQFSACGQGTPLTLPRGTHVLRGNGGGYLKVISVSLSPTETPPYAGSSSSTRSVTVTSWGSQHRAVTVGPGPASYLIVKQNYNSGWTAEMGNQRLTPVRIDGWQQAWVVPKGSGGVITLDYAPDLYLWIELVVGAALALVLLGLALWPSKRPDDSPSLHARTSIPSVAAVLAATICLVILGGALALVLFALLAVAWLTRSRVWLPVLAAVSILFAGITVALHVGTYPTSGIGAFGPSAQIAAFVALAAVLSAAVVASDRWKGRRTEDFNTEKGGSVL